MREEKQNNRRRTHLALVIVERAVLGRGFVGLTLVITSGGADGPVGWWDCVSVREGLPRASPFFSVLFLAHTKKRRIPPRHAQNSPAGRQGRSTAA